MGRFSGFPTQTALAQRAALVGRNRPRGERRGDLKEIRQPTLVVNGNHDITLPTINSYILAQNTPQAELIIYPDSGHGSLSISVTFVDHVSRFGTRNPPSARFSPGWTVWSGPAPGEFTQISRKAMRSMTLSSTDPSGAASGLARDLPAAVMRQEKVPDLELFRRCAGSKLTPPDVHDPRISSPRARAGTFTELSQKRQYS